jgi:hypothetical protein
MGSDTAKVQVNDVAVIEFGMFVMATFRRSYILNLKYARELKTIHPKRKGYQPFKQLHT